MTARSAAGGAGRFAARLLATAAACGALGYWGAGVAFSQSGDRIRLVAAAVEDAYVGEMNIGHGVCFRC